MTTVKMLVQVKADEWVSKKEFLFFDESSKSLNLFTTEQGLLPKGLPLDQKGLEAFSATMYNTHISLQELEAFNKEKDLNYNVPFVRALLDAMRTEALFSGGPENVRVVMGFVKL